ncbi:MAG: sauU 3 [Gemmataceae bacterium]|nr:sauU 3 [Gemmataceae bacterium]
MSLPDPDRPTRARFVLAAWLCGLAVVLYLDRFCFSQAVKPMREELGLSKADMGYVMMAFTLAYGLFEIPTGRLGDRLGSRFVLVRIVLWWAAFTALTGVAGGFASLVVIRFLFGVGEAGAYPNAARVISRWFPLHERGRVQGAMLTAAQFGAFAAPPLAAYLIRDLGWRWSFVVFGLFGVVWAVGFWIWFRDDPAAHPRVSAAELDVIRDGLPPPPDPGPIPWRAIVTNRGILILGVIQMLGAFFTYLFFSWFPTYLEEAHGVSNIEAGWLASLALAGGVVGVFVGGVLADRITARSPDPVRARRLFAVGCYLTTAACLFGGVRCDDVVTLSGLFCVAFCVMHLTLPNWWSLAIPQGGRHVGTVFGLMNGMGVVGAMASQGFVGKFADWQKDQGLTGRAQWDPLYEVYVVLLLAAAVVWWLYRFTPLDDPQENLSQSDW